MSAVAVCVMLESVERPCSGGGHIRWGWWGLLHRHRGGAVVELLLGAKQQIEHLRAQVLAQGQRQDRTDDDQQQGTPKAAFAFWFGCRLLDRIRRVAQRRRRFGELLLQLAILEQRLARRLAVADTPVGAASR